MKYLKLFEELTGKYKEETEIIYKDRNLVCLLPKSQMMSSIYGSDTQWCTISKIAFDYTSKKGNLLIRFMFKDGYKLRLTMDIEDGKCDWANKVGYHLLERKIKEAFNLTLGEMRNEDLREVTSRIKSIPEECQKNVMNFYEKWKDGYKEYIKKDDKYMPFKIKKINDEFDQIESKYRSKIDEFNDKGGDIVDINIDTRNRQLLLKIGDNLESFKSVKEFEDRLKRII